MKILFYSRTFFPKDIGGTENYLLSLIQRLKKKHELSLILPNRHNISIKDIKIYYFQEFDFNSNLEKDINIKSSILNTLRFFSCFISTLIKLPFILIKNKIEIVNIMEPSIYSTMVLMISRLFKKRVVINLRGYPGKVTWLTKIGKLTNFFFSNNILSNSKDMLNKYKQYFHLPEFITSKKNNYYIPNGIDTNFWKPDKSQQIKKEYDLVYFGHLVNKNIINGKGFKYLYNVLKYLRKNNNLGLKVMVIGSYNEVLLNRMIAPNINRYFDFIGIIKDKHILKDKIQKSRLFVLPYNAAGMPNSLMEAMALEMPCIASNVGAVSELIEHNKNGLIIKSKKEIELANLILALLSDKHLQRELGVNARKKIINIFNWNIIIKKIEKFYEYILKD
ncbi:MAG: glycosyltransferase family 4 protein [Candidatus Hodarchaeota archaeon]